MEALNPLKPKRNTQKARLPATLLQPGLHLQHRESRWCCNGHLDLKARLSDTTAGAAVDAGTDTAPVDSCAGCQNM